MKTHRAARGQAAVELAVTMIMLVPLIFFALFLEDFAYYKTEGQEPVVAAASDFVIPDYMKAAPTDGDLARFNRLKFCDHTAGYDSYDVQFECNAPPGGGGSGGAGGGLSTTGESGAQMGHHHATGAHQCWLGGGKELHCNISKGVDALAIPASQPFLTFYGTNWNNGGIAECTAQLKIFNWIIPRQLGQKGAWWNKTAGKAPGGGGGGDQDQLALQGKGQFANGSGDVTGDQREWKDYNFQQIHDDGKNNTQMGSWLLDEVKLQTVVDPWALTHIAAINPHEGSPITTFLKPGLIPGTDFYHPLLDRTGNYYNYYAGDAADKAMDWQKDMKDKDFLDEFSGWDVAGDEMHSVPVTWMPAKPRSRNSGYASGYEDSRQQSANRSNKFPSTWGPN